MRFMNHLNEATITLLKSPWESRAGTDFVASPHGPTADVVPRWLLGPTSHIALVQHVLGGEETLSVLEPQMYWKHSGYTGVQVPPNR